MAENGQADGGNPAKKENKLILRVLGVALAVLFAALAGAGGFLLWYYLQDPDARTLDWVKGMVRRHYYWDLGEDTLENATLSQLFGLNGEEALLDRYSAYYTAEALRARTESQEGNQNGIGASFLLTNEGLQFYRVNGNSPAEEGGLTAGMYVLGYGDTAEDTEAYTDFNAFSDFISAQADGEVFYILAGEEATGEGTAHAVYKAAYTQNYVFYADAERSYRFVGEDADELTYTEEGMEELPDDVAYIRIDSFAGDAAAQFEGLLEVFESRGKTGLLLDLRNNGGGQLSVLVKIAAFLCKEADGKFPVLSVEYKDGSEEIYCADANDYYEYFTDQTEIVVLANCNTASASEALLGAMIDYGTVDYGDVYLAEIGGEARTYGKGIMQTTYSNILTGEGVKLTTAVIRWPVSDTCIHDRGILPADGAVAVPCDGYLDNGGGMLRAVVGHFG